MLIDIKQQAVNIKMKGSQQTRLVWETLGYCYIVYKNLFEGSTKIKLQGVSFYCALSTYMKEFEDAKATAEVYRKKIKNTIFFLNTIVISPVH